MADTYPCRTLLFATVELVKSQWHVEWICRDIYGCVFVNVYCEVLREWLCINFILAFNCSIFFLMYTCNSSWNETMAYSRNTFTFEFFWRVAPPTTVLAILARTDKELLPKWGGEAWVGHLAACQQLTVRDHVSSWSRGTQTNRGRLVTASSWLHRRGYQT